MPALRAFGRRWYLGSDDLVYPTLLELVIRFVWLIALAVVYVFRVVQNGGADVGRIKIIYVGTMAFLAAYLVIDIAIAVVSAQGYIMDVYPRRHVSTLLYVKLAILIPEVGWTTLATMWMFGLSADCGPVVISLAKAAVITEWIIIACLLVSVYLMFDPLGKRSLKKRSLKDYQKMWYRRCRYMCCCLRHDENRADAFEEIATLFSLFFHGRDLVITDIMAGVILLSVKQRYERQTNPKAAVEISETATLQIRGCYRSDYQSDGLERLSWNENSVNAGQESRFYVESEKTRLCDVKGKRAPDYGTTSSEDGNVAGRTGSRHQPIQDNSLPPSGGMEMSESVFCLGLPPPTPPKQWMTLENAAYYLRYATAIYGSSNYSGCYNCGDRIPLCRKYRWFKDDPHLPAEILRGDNYWECEASSVMLYSRLDRTDIIYADLDNQIFKTPYFIARDDNRRTVVVAIRGTMSAGDALTDLTAQGEDIKIERLPRGNVHKGIMKVAKKIKDQLEEEIHLKSKIPKGYSLVITGHSLGAGVAAVLSLLIHDQFPEVTCFAFSPPGGLVSLPLSIYLQQFVLSCFLGMDVVARLGVINLEKLKSDLLAVIKNSRLPKYKILSSGLCSLCCSCMYTSDDVLLEDTQTTSLAQVESVATASTWQHMIWIDDDASMIGDDERQSDVDSVSRQSCETTTSSVRSVDPEQQSRYGSWSSDRGRKTHSPLEARSSTLSQSSIKSCDSRTSICSTSSLSRSRGKRNKDTASQAISQSHAKWRKKQQNKKVGLAATDPLYLPGQILYLYEDEEMTTETCCNSEPVYKARWARAEEFDSIPLHSKMMYHHNPYTVDEAIQQILSQGEYYVKTIYIGDTIDSQPPGVQYLDNSFDSGIQEDKCLESADGRKQHVASDKPEDGEDNTGKTSAIDTEAESKTGTASNRVDKEAAVPTGTSPEDGRVQSVQRETVCWKELPVEIERHQLQTVCSYTPSVSDENDAVTESRPVTEEYDIPSESTDGKASPNQIEDNVTVEDKGDINTYHESADQGCVLTNDEVDRSVCLDQRQEDVLGSRECYTEIAPTLECQSDVILTPESHTDVASTAECHTDVTSTVGGHTDAVSIPERHADVTSTSECHTTVASTPECHTDVTSTVGSHTDAVSIPERHEDVTSTSECHTAVASTPECHTDVTSTGGGHTDAVSIPERHEDVTSTSECHTAVASTPECHTDVTSTGGGHTDVASTSECHTDVTSTLGGHTDVVSIPEYHTDVVSTPECHTAVTSSPECYTDVTSTVGGQTDVVSIPECHTDVASAPKCQSDVASTSECHTDVTSTLGGHTDVVSIPECHTYVTSTLGGHTPVTSIPECQTDVTANKELSSAQESDDDELVYFTI